MSISIRLPFQESTEGGVFGTTKTTSDKIRTNLISLLTLKKKQRPMHNALYSPLYDYIMEPWDEISEDKLKEALIDKITIYITEINLDDIQFMFDETDNLLTVKVIYSIPGLGGAQNSVEVSVAMMHEN